MSTSYKYPRTFHVPWSPGTSSDDRLFTQEEMERYFHGRTVVVTEKLDGENTTLYRDRPPHARSVDSRPHPSQNWIRQLAATIQHEIPVGWRICGENLYAQHSIRYDKLTSFFYVFSMWNEKNICLSWSETEQYAAMLGLQCVPLRWLGTYDGEGIRRTCWTGTSVYGPEQEGYVIRTVEEFPYPELSKEHEMPVFTTLAKYVRAKHVNTTDHWRQTWVPNQLA